MKKIMVLFIVVLLSVFLCFADSQIEGTKVLKDSNARLTDNSFVIQGYYKGTTQTVNNVTLTIMNKGDQSIQAVSQESTGSSVFVTDDNFKQEGSPDRTIFKWSLTGKGKTNTTLRFSFSVFQAELYDLYYKPAYTITMTKNDTYKYSNNTPGNTAISDSFAITNTSTNPITETRVDANQERFTGASTISYSGKITADYWSGGFSSSDYWYRSGICTLNITDYKNDLPGTYRYVCWVVVEYLVE